MKNIKFKCSNCENESIESVSVNATVHTEINELAIDESEVVEVYYGAQEMTGGEVLGFQCSHCGLYLTDENGEKITNKDEICESEDITIE